MKVIAIDPGYDRVGVSVIEKNDSLPKEVIVYSTCLLTDKKRTLDERIASVGDGLKTIIREYKPDVMAIESLFMTNNQKTVMGVSEARGVIKYVGHLEGLKVYEYTPLQIKIAITGYGRSSKDAVLAMIPRLVALPDKKMLDDEVDAIAVGLTFFAHYRPGVV